MLLATGWVDSGGARLLRRDGRVVPLAPREVALLTYLGRAGGRDVPRDELLAEVFEAAPDSRSRALDTAMRRLRTKVERDPDHPRQLITVHGVGYRFLPLSPAEPPTNMTHETTAFVGRQALLRTLRDAVATSGLLTLTGAPGSGKSRTARELGRQLRQGLPGGVWFVSAADAGSIDELTHRVRAALRTPASSVDELGVALAARGPLLLIVDNLEALAHEATALLGRWHQLAPMARILATSQVPVAGRCIDMGPLDDDEGAELFRQVAARVSPHPVEDGPALRRVVRQLDGLPLALELAAARTGVLGLRQLETRLTERFRLLGSGGRTSLRASLEHAWALLEPELRSVLGQLTVFRGGFDLDAAEAVIHSESQSVAQAIEALRRRSLVHDQDGRPGLLASIGAFAADRLDDDLVHARHARWFGRWVSRGDLESDEDIPEEHERDLANMLAAADWAWHHDHDLAACLATGASMTLVKQGRLHMAIDVMSRALRLPDLDPQWRIRLMSGRAAARRRTGDLEGAHQDFSEALARCRASGARLTEGTVLGNLGAMWVQQGRFEEGLDALGRAITLLETEGATHMVPHLQLSVGTALKELGQQERAREVVEQARERFASTGRAVGAAIARANLAVLDGEAGRTREAVAGFEEVLALHRARGIRRLEAMALANLGKLALGDGDVVAAERYLQQALDIFWSAGVLRMVGAVQSLLAVVHIVRGSHEAAASAVEEAVPHLALLHRIDAGRVLWARSLVRLARHGRVEAIEDLAAAADAVGSSEARLAAAIAAWRAFVERGETGPIDALQSYEADMVGSVMGWMGEG